MIRVLQNWQEINAATCSHQTQGKQLHLDIHKNWDQKLLNELVTYLDKTDCIIDLGCGDYCTLDFLAAEGFTNLHGIDLKLKPRDSAPYSLYQRDITDTAFADSSCDVAVSISVIEHGVDLPKFFAEVYRILKPNGLLFITTDYWETNIDIDSSIKPFGLEWKIFSRNDIEELIELAAKNNLVVEKESHIPACSEQPIHWHGYKYTFIALAFRATDQRF